MTQSTAEGTSILGVAIRDINRLRRVSAIVARHGFGGLWRRTALGRFLPGAESEKVSAESAPQRFTALLAELGPTYIKLGQVLSMRPDLLPPEYIEALESLQDNAPPLNFDDVRTVVEQGLGRPFDELFKDFQEAPLATASIGQTHLATTHDGERVVVKVQRPGIEAVMRGDLDLLYLGAKALEASIEEMDILGPSDIVVEFERALLTELNFTAELSNLKTMGQLVESGRNVKVPTPHPELTSKTVLTMEYFEGKPLRCMQRDDPMTKKVVEEILHVSCKQVFIDGFFHGDPHAGNILVNDAGEVCLIDLGLVGTLTQDQRDDLVTLVLATIANDASSIARVLLKMGTPTQRVNLSELKSEIHRMRSTYLTVGSLEEYRSDKFAEEFAAAAQRFRIKLAPEYAILVKAAASIEGIIRALDPEADLVGITRPYVERIMADRYAPGKLLAQAVGGVSGIGAMVRALPSQLDQILHDMETGNTQVRAVTPALDEIPTRLHQLASRVSLMGFASAMSICAAILLAGDAKGGGVAFLTGMCITFAVVGWTILWWWHFTGKGRARVSPLLKFFKRG